MSTQSVFPQGLSPLKPFSLNCKGKFFSFDRPVVMGILNVTPDSFFDGGRFLQRDAILLQAQKLIQGGATIIDIGGASSRPGSAFIDINEELDRVVQATELIHAEYPDTLISTDTWRSKVAEAAIMAGSSIINDISGGTLDPAIVQVAINHKTPYVLMHMQGTPQTMQQNPEYTHVLNDVILSIQKRVSTYREMGLNDIIVDPGFGFGKTLHDNYRLLGGLNRFHMLGCPVLAGISRKSMITRLLQISPSEALNGTTCLNTVALMKGASILRVHDAEEASQCIRIMNTLIEANSHQNDPA